MDTPCVRVLMGFLARYDKPLFAINHVDFIFKIRTNLKKLTPSKLFVPYVDSLFVRLNSRRN